MMHGQKNIKLYVCDVFVFLGSIIICLLYKLAFSHRAQVTL